MAELLTTDEIDRFLDAHPEWSGEGHAIQRTFTFTDFNESMGFVVRVAMASEVADHHPDIDVRWNKVTITLSTHSEGGLTGRDVDLAVHFDAMV
jgi:4a-hydroxytetrahydrobiopterin dehydratase